MALFGSDWKDEVSNEEKYEQITGQKYAGDNLRKDIEHEIDSGYTSKESRSQLLDLLADLNKLG